LFGANLLYRNGLSKHDSGLILGDLKLDDWPEYSQITFRGHTSPLLRARLFWRFTVKVGA